MAKRIWVAATACVAALALSGCAHNRGGVFAGRNAPDEFVVGRAAPLTVPPDYALVPPRPGQPRPQEADSSTQALQAMFGGPAPAPPAEEALVKQAGTVPPAGVRSEVGAPGTEVVDKGSTTNDILNAPPSASTNSTANATTPAAAAAPSK